MIKLLDFNNEILNISLFLFRIFFNNQHNKKNKKT